MLIGVKMSKSFPAGQQMKQALTTDFAKLRLRAQMSTAEAAQRFGVSERTVYRWDVGQGVPKPPVLRELARLSAVSPKTAETKTVAFRFVDLFAGIGGLRLAFEAAGGRCVFTSEWDAACQQTYRANFPSDEHEIAGDIREVVADNIPDFDVLVAGFPCQPFSIAGVSKKNALGRPHGFRCDTQGTLFFEVARIIEDRKPAAFLLENVKNLVNHDKGRTFEIVRRTLEQELGYSISCRVIDGKYWTPQHRERIFIAGFRNDVGLSLSDIALPDDASPRLGSILHSEDGSEEVEHPYTSGVLAEVTSKYFLSNHLWRYLQDYAAKHKARGNGFGFGLVGSEDIARTLSARYYKDGSEILVTRGRRRPPRRLTPRECARLMGFDQRGESSFVIPVSDTQAYRQFGNSVVVPAATAVAKHMAPAIQTILGKQPIEPELPFLMPRVAVAA